MNKFNAISVNINDLIKHQEREVAHKKRLKESTKLARSSYFIVDHSIACAEAILTLLKKYKRDPQTDLFEALNTLQNGNNRNKKN